MKRTTLFSRLLPLIVLLAALAVRLTWLSDKQALYGDELTSLSLAYDNPGWGPHTFTADSAYTGASLRRLLYTDGGRGWQGLCDDLAALHHDNRDASHASLYYMLLRLALTGCSATHPAEIARRAALPNVAFFLLSFVALWWLLRRVMPGRPTLIAACLFVAFLNPAAVSLTLLVREYALAECLFSLWALFIVCAASSSATTPLAHRRVWWLAGIPLAACLISAGYFNALFLLLTLAWLGWLSVRQGTWRRDGWSLIALPLLALVLAWAMYAGFFHFVTDVRTHEVTGKLQGQAWLANLLTSARQGVRLLLLHVFTPTGALLAGVALAGWAVRKATERRRSHRTAQTKFGPTLSAAVTDDEARLPNYQSKPYARYLASPLTALLVCAMGWIGAAIWLSPWKMTHYFSPAVPLMLALLGAWLFPSMKYGLPEWLRQSRKLCLGVSVVCAVAFLAWQPVGIEHLNHLTGLPDGARTAKRIYLYGPNADESNTLTSLSPCLGEHQECIILRSPSDVQRARSTSADARVYVFAYRECTPLRSLSGFVGELPFNDWMAVYILSQPHDESAQRG